MTNYAAKAGHNEALVDLVTLIAATTTFNPTSAGVEYERTVAISGKESFRGQGFTQWVFPAISYADFNALMTLLGLSATAISNNVTIYTLKSGTTFARYNCICHLPTPNDGLIKSQGAYRNLVVRFTRLQAL